jgi:hypothetical protein
MTLDLTFEYTVSFVSEIPFNFIFSPDFAPPEAFSGDNIFTTISEPESNEGAGVVSYSTSITVDESGIYGGPLTVIIFSSDSSGGFVCEGSTDTILRVIDG